MSQSINEVLGEHIPYRLTHLDGLQWANRAILSGDPRRPISVELGGKRVIQGIPLGVLTNALSEVGILYCRVMAGFLGVRLSKKPSRLEPLDLAEHRRPGDSRMRRRKGDSGIEKLNLKPVSVDQLLGATGGDPAIVEQAVIATLASADLGVAHFTNNPVGRSRVDNSELCASAVIAATEKYVYGEKRMPVPFFRLWTTFGALALRAANERQETVEQTQQPGAGGD